MPDEQTFQLPTASTRVHQDMAGEEEAVPGWPPAPIPRPEPVEPTPSEFQAPIASVRPSLPPIPTGMTEGADMAASPFAAPSADAVWPFWLSVTAVVCAIPPAVFWLLSLVYVLGAPGPFVTIMEVLPTWTAVLVGGGLPVVSVVSAGASLMRTYPGARGRFWAWLALIASVAYFLGLGLWFLDELVSNQ